MFNKRSTHGSEPPSGPTENGGATPAGQLQWMQTELNRHSDALQRQSEQLGAIKATLDQVNTSIKKIEDHVAESNKSITAVNSRLSRIIWMALGGVGVIAFVLSPYLKKLVDFLALASGQGG